jgi:hypothetical protein
VSNVNPAAPGAPAVPVPSGRFTPDNATILDELGFLAELAGDWQGQGFNLIARPDFVDHANLYLQLNRTNETLRIRPIGSPIPNRGFGQADISLFGLHYLQEISDLATGSALHIEPGLWVTQPNTSYPPQFAPGGSQIVTRMGSIPHGTTILAQGTATQFNGTPVLASGPTPYAFSQFPSFNSTPFGVPPGTFNAAGSSEKLTAAALNPPKAPFTEYDLSIPAGAANPRSPFNTNPAEPPLPDPLEGVALQDVVDRQVKSGHSFSGVVVNIASQASINFLTTPNDPTGPSTTVNVIDGDGGVANIVFLQGGQPVGAEGPNANIATVYATFWVEDVLHHTIPKFKQLQYAQMVVLDFEILSILPANVLLGWPHITVGTLRKPFG